MEISPAGPFALGADALRRLALDEDLKQRVMADPALAAIARRIARRYVAGETVQNAIDRARSIVNRGHRVSIEFVGESVRDAEVADAATATFLDVVDQIGEAGLPSTVSLDLSHVGLTVDPALGLNNARRIAAAATAAGIEMMISAEGSDRTDHILATYEQLALDSPNVGITVQARLHRTADDLARVVAMPGRVRLVKGAFYESDRVAFHRDSDELRQAYLGFAGHLISSGHAVSIATHDQEILDALQAAHGDLLRSPHVEFEMLLGLGVEALDRLQQAGLRTREYLVFGDEWWLYVLNRIAEQPERLHTAIADAAG